MTQKPVTVVTLLTRHHPMALTTPPAKPAALRCEAPSLKEVAEPQRGRGVSEAARRAAGGTRL